MSRRMFFVKLNLDELGHDMAILDQMPSSAYEAWLRGFNKGSRGIEPTASNEPGDMGQRMGYNAFLAARAFSASRASNRAGGSKKRKERRENPEESSVTSSDPHMMQHMSQDILPSPGVSTPDPLPKPAHMIRFEAQYHREPPLPQALPFEETPEGKACIARREEIRAKRLAKESQRA